MSKSTFKKFKKNDYSYDDEEDYNPRAQFDKHKAKRIDRALKTKDISALVEDDDGLDPIDVEDEIYSEQLNWKYN